MARAIWSGVLSFGLVSVPVELYSATQPHRPVFHEFEEGSADRIRYERVNERTGDEVEYSDIVKGAEVDGGNYVLLDQDELASVAPGRSRLLEIHAFVDLDDIDPLYFNKAYFLGPRGEETGKVYALLRDAMGHADKAAIASFVMRGKEYLAAVRADGDVLVLQTLFFADEVRDSHQEISDLPGKVKLSAQEMRMARQLVDSMSGPWKPSDYRDTYTDRINELIDAKRTDKEVQPAAAAPAATDVVDLAAALRASVAAAKKTPAAGRSGADRRGAAKPPAKAAAKERSAKKAPGSRTARKPRRKRAA
jgi:DNA end-binding protein Ku